MRDLLENVKVKRKGLHTWVVEYKGEKVLGEYGLASNANIASRAYKEGLQRGREEAQQPQQEECYRCGHPIPDGEDPQPEPETVDNKIYPTDGYDEVYVPSRELRVCCVHAIEHESTLGYVVEGLEDLPDDQLPQMPVVWVYTSGGGLPPYLFHPPAPVSRDVYERTRAHAMRFKVEANNES